MNRAVEKFKKDNKKTTFILQLTAMVDMFTIIIVFLLKSFSTSAVNITPQDGLKLPHSTSYENPVEGLKLIVSMDGIYLDDKKVIILNEGKMNSQETQANDESFIKELYSALDKEAEKTKEIQKENEDHKFEGIVVMQADSRLSYGLLKKVMYTASMAGYADLKMATLSFDWGMLRIWKIKVNITY